MRISVPAPALPTLLCLLCLPAVRADVVSQTAQAVDEAVVTTTAEARVSVVPLTGLTAGRHPAGTALGTWEASVTGGAVAWRLTRDINPAVAASPEPGTGLATNRRDRNTLPVTLVRTSGGASTSAGLATGWLTLASGITAAAGGIQISSAGGTSWPVTPGAYPVGIDVVAWSD